MLAHEYKSEKHGISGWFVSEKLDGMRCFWDGGITRGLPKTEVPWANNDADERYLVEPIATGLWSRLGNVIHAPDWWLDALPPMLLDGELFTKRRDQQNLMSIVKDLEPGEGWEQVRYFVFDSPPPDVVFANGLVDVTNFCKAFIGCDDWFKARATKLTYQATTASVFKGVNTRLQREISDNTVVKVHAQIQLPNGPAVREALNQVMDVFVNKGGEGVILRDPHSWWAPERSHSMLKYKEKNDAEGTVIGYTTGRQTDKGSKLLGLMGALILDFNGKRFELSGFTDEERSLDWTPGVCRAECTETPLEWAINNPGLEVPEWIQAREFPRGTNITFTYRELTRDGIPKEARYFRKRS